MAELLAATKDNTAAGNCIQVLLELVLWAECLQALLQMHAEGLRGMLVVLVPRDKSEASANRKEEVEDNKAVLRLHLEGLADRTDKEAVEEDNQLQVEVQCLEHPVQGIHMGKQEAAWHQALLDEPAGWGILHICWAQALVPSVLEEKHCLPSAAQQTKEHTVQGSRYLDEAEASDTPLMLQEQNQNDHFRYRQK